MTPPHFQKGQEVEIIGPSLTNDTTHIGERIKIDQIYLSSKESWYSKCGYPGYPASSLRLVEDLQSGDYVEIIGKDIYDEWDPDYPKGSIFQITQVRTKPVSFSAFGYCAFPPNSLRKLTPDEIAKHLAPTKEDLDQIEKKFKIDRRLSAIEKRLGAQKDAIIEIDRVLKVRKVFMDEFNERIAVLEGERPEVIDRKQIRIPENANISMRSDQNGKVVIEYSESGFELAKAVLDNMKEA